MVLPNFNQNLEKYAQLITEVGVNVQKGHTIVIQIAVDQAPLARLLTKKAYALGAAEVIVQWTDDVVQKEFLAHADSDRLETIPQYKIDQTDDWVAKGASRISVVSANPDALAGVDSDRVATYQAASGKAMINLRKATQANKVSWTVVAAAGQDWAQKVFPDATQKKRKTCFGIKFSKQRASMKKTLWQLGRIMIKRCKKKPMNSTKNNSQRCIILPQAQTLLSACQRTIYGKVPAASMPVAKSLWQTCQQKRSLPLLIAAASMAISQVRNH